MLVWLLRGILLVEFGISTLIGTFAPNGSGVFLGAVAFVTIFFVAPLPGLLLSWAIARRWGSTRAGEGAPTAAARIAEWAAFVFLFGIVMPFERAFLGAEAAVSATSGRPPVLLVPGYMCNRGLWWWFRRRLRRAGFAVATVTLETPVSDIERLADGLDRRIEALRAETGAERVTLVTHSMGGLVARALLRRPGAASRVAGFVTLAGPHHGTVPARAGWGRNAAQMRIGSPWLAELARAPRPDVPTLSIWSTGDAIVVPQTSSRLEGAEEIVLPAIGHLSMVLSPRVADLVVAELRRADAASRGGAPA